MREPALRNEGNEGNEAKQSHCCAMTEIASPSLRLRASASALAMTVMKSASNNYVIFTTMSPMMLAVSSPRSAALERWRYSSRILSM